MNKNRYQILSIDRLAENIGQIEGLPTNPREISDEKFEQLKHNIEQHPEFLKYNMLKVFPVGEQYVVIGGNMRLKALRDLGYTQVPCAILDADTDAEELKAYTILDNVGFGKWDWIKLEQDWSGEQLEDWGIDVDWTSPNSEDCDSEDCDNEDCDSEDCDSEVSTKRAAGRIVPLPFQGNKSGFAKEIRKAVASFESVDTIVDLFGGSGLCSRIAKDARPDCRVIYNDHDHFDGRIAAIPRTNEILRKVRQIVKSVPENSRIPKNKTRAILRLLEDYEQKGTVDYITLSASLLFSGQYATTLKGFNQTMWNRVVKTPYAANGWLDGLEIVHCDYKDLTTQFSGNNILFICDPPYLSTDTKSYKDLYWGLLDYLNVLTEIRGSNFLFFTSNKSELTDLSEWLFKTYEIDLFASAERKMHRNYVNFENSYEDVMLIKRI